MERIQSLINRLQDQFQNQAATSQMQLTLQLLQAELSKLQQQEGKRLGTAKVAVLMPLAAQVSLMESVAVNGDSQYEAPPLSVVEETEPARNNLPYNPLTEIPTLSHQDGVMELNEKIATREASMNDKLREKKTEVGESLGDSPIRDLRKAIGINDRYLFLSELFRGDEAMYERSIKTINGFSIYPEAEYWMNRELKVKLGWDENRETVKLLYQMVRRRFS